MTRGFRFLRAVPLLLSACGPATGPELVPPYEGPMTTGQPNPTGYQPGSIDINDLVGGGGIFGGPVSGVHTYEVVPVPGIDWNTADGLAKTTLKNGVPGHLATITSAEENAAIEVLRKAAGAGEVWVGGFQPPGSAEPGGGWTWVNGEGAIPGTNGGTVYANWVPNEPNDCCGGEHHLTIGLQNDGKWNDEHGACSGYVVEWDY